jgi:GNAT superfamily N-acetyltransferase
MQPGCVLSTAETILPLRVRHRQEMNCQIVHDSIHQRAGWMLTYALTLGSAVAGFSSVAIAGPWKDKPTILEFYVLPEYRSRAFHLFEVFVATSGARLMEIQSNDTLLAVMLHTYARDIWSEKIVFRDQLTTMLPPNGAVLHGITPNDDVRESIAQRQGGGEFELRLDGQSIATGGILFHYNLPYGDVYMEVTASHRQRGFGSYLVQELKRVAYDFGAVPCARCNPANVASRKTLQKAGFVPFAHILNGSIHAL